MRNILEDHDAMVLIQCLKDKGYTADQVETAMLAASWKEEMGDLLKRPKCGETESQLILEEESLRNKIS